jgi:tetratricopeptide (TPR) repeat protein
VPPSPKLVRCLFLLFIGAGPACGGAAAKGAGFGVRPVASINADEGIRQDVVSLETNPKVDRAQVRLTVLEQHARERLDRALLALSRAAGETGFTDLGVLVELSARQIERGSLGAGSESAADLANAEANLTRVLAIDEHSASAFTQLALLHLAKAKTRGRRELELAMGICLQAMREHPAYAPLRNTTGLVEFELRDGAGAIREFEAAVKLDGSYSEAQMNLAASLLSTRRFEAAERAYDRVLDVSNDYEALLGRALARRGQINDANFRAQVASVDSDLERCKELDPERPEAYYNQAILAERFQVTVAPTEKATSVLERARSLFDTVIAKAAERPEYAREIRLAKQRVRDLSSK